MSLFYLFFDSIFLLRNTICSQYVFFDKILALCSTPMLSILRVAIYNIHIIIYNIFFIYIYTYYILPSCSVIYLFRSILLCDPTYKKKGGQRKSRSTYNLGSFELQAIILMFGKSLRWICRRIYVCSILLHPITPTWKRFFRNETRNIYIITRAALIHHNSNNVLCVSVYI